MSAYFALVPATSAVRLGRSCRGLTATRRLTTAAHFGTGLNRREQRELRSAWRRENTQNELDRIFEGIAEVRRRKSAINTADRENRSAATSVSAALAELVA